MQLKHYLYATLCILVTQASISQTAMSSVVTTAGGYTVNETCSLSWTLGEPIIETGSSNDNFITQGFQQLESIIINDADNSNASVTRVAAYPNPVSDIVYVKSTSNEPLRVYIEGLDGQNFGDKQITSKDNGLNLGNLASGIYLLRVYTANKQLIQTLKVDKIH